jgi:hypothetical protein
MIPELIGHSKKQDVENFFLNFIHRGFLLRSTGFGYVFANEQERLNVGYKGNFFKIQLFSLK